MKLGLKTVRQYALRRVPPFYLVRLWTSPPNRIRRLWLWFWIRVTVHFGLMQPCMQPQVLSLWHCEYSVRYLTIVSYGSITIRAWSWVFDKETGSNSRETWKELWIKSTFEAYRPIYIYLKSNTSRLCISVATLLGDLMAVRLLVSNSCFYYGCYYVLGLILSYVSLYRKLVSDL